MYLYRLLVALTTVFQSTLNNAGVVTCACKAAQYILPNIATDIQQILVERLHTAIIGYISKYHSTEQEICYDILLHVLPHLWKIDSSVCKNAVAEPAFVELLTSKLSVLVYEDIHGILPYAVLLSKHLEHWKSIISDLELAGVHRTFRAIFRMYSMLSVEDLCGVLDVLCNFVSHGTQNTVTATHVNQYVSEDMHTHLIIMIQDHITVLGVQELAWKLMRLLCRYQKQFAYALIHTGLLHCASGFLTKDNVMQLKQYTVEFLAIVVMSFGEFNPYFFQVPGLIESVAELVKDNTVEERYMLMACCIISRLTNKMTASLLPEILNLDVLETLKKRALLCPEKFLIPVCEFLNNIVCSGKNIGFNESELPNAVFQNHHLFYQEVLNKEAITGNPKLTVVILQSLNQFIRSFPRNAFEETLCTKPFIETLLSLFQECKDSMVMYSITALLHVLFYLIRAYGSGPKIVYECDAHVALAKAFTKSLTTSLAEELLALFLCLFVLYSNNKTTNAILDVSLHKSLIDVAKKFGRFQCQKLGDEYARCILTTTADKEFSKKLVSLNYMDEITPLISETYCAPIFKASLHAQGNLAICGADVKLKLINEDELHLRIISYIREHTMDGNAGVLSACCRVLHILASGDRAKRLFIDVGCIEVMLRLLKLRTDDTEICWRPLGTLSSLGFTALCNRHPFIRQNILKTVCGIIRGSLTDKAKGYASLILICICEREDGVCLVRNSGIMEDLVNIIAASSNEDLQRWGSIVSEKLSLYTVAFPDMPQEKGEDSVDGGIQGISRVIEENADFPSHGTDTLQHRSPKLDPRIKQCIGDKMPEDAFCIGRMFGSTYGMCSNCEHDDMSAELVMRVHDMSPMQYQHLIDNGWYRRGGVKMFRLRENHNMKCCDWETRVDALKFNHTTSKSYRKVLRRMPNNISIKTLPAYYNKEAFDLYNTYHVSKHDKPIKSEHSYTEHVVYSPYRQQEGKGGIVYGTYHQEYYLGDKLAAVGVIDVVPYGVVSIYMWYDNSKEINRYSFGVYSALKEIEYVCSLNARNPDMKYYYLQGWNPQNKKLSYKANYTPVEFFCPCISTEWIPRISGVEECIDNKLKAAEAAKDSVANHSLTLPALTAISKTVNAFDVAVGPYEEQHGPIDIYTVPVCLDLTQFNNADTHSFMTLGEAITLYQIKDYQVETMKKRYKELIVALGQPLAKQFYIVLKVCRLVFETSV